MFDIIMDIRKLIFISRIAVLCVTRLDDCPVLSAGGYTLRAELVLRA